MKKKYYLIGDLLFFGTAKKAQQKNRELGSVGIRKIINKRELKQLLELAA
tara:strand:+ start:2243 stop:2392 length:150 start_codon:yes stop_codon:yes gene_type:complete